MGEGLKGHGAVRPLFPLGPRLALRALGADVTQGPDFLDIQGRARLTGGTVDACNDHRIAMMAAVAAVACEQPVTILGAECVKKSYPGFWQDYEMLGGKVHGLVLR